MTTEQQIEVMQAYVEGKQIECCNSTNSWTVVYPPSWNWIEWNYRVKPEEPKPLTREQITAHWVKDNNVKAGDRLKVIDCYSKHFGKETIVNGVSEFGIHTDLDFLCVEVFQKLDCKIIPYSFEDRELFRDKWVRFKNCQDEFKIIAISSAGVAICGSDRPSMLDYEYLLDRMEFSNGTTLGKEVWE